MRNSIFLELEYINSRIGNITEYLRSNPPASKRDYYSYMLDNLCTRRDRLERMLYDKNNEYSSYNYMLSILIGLLLGLFIIFLCIILGGYPTT